MRKPKNVLRWTDENGEFDPNEADNPIRRYGLEGAAELERKAAVPKAMRAPHHRRLPVVQQPTPAEVLFEPPFVNGARKTCMNCGLFVESQPTTCAIHGELQVAWDAICGYHVAGRPMSPRTARELDFAVVSPALSGLERVPGGTSCDICAHYRRIDRESGTCVAVYQEPVVAARACCSRWTK